MSDARTPLRFFGAREDLEGELGRFLLNGVKHRRLYDPFCGSASMTFFAMRNDLADEYVVGDVERPLMDFWSLVKALPEVGCTMSGLTAQRDLLGCAYPADRPADPDA